jgi:2'-phosphotransferase
MRSDCDLFIELDGKLATENGYKIYKSKNEVILSPGINGVIPSLYFKRVF